MDVCLVLNASKQGYNFEWECTGCGIYNLWFYENLTLIVSPFLFCQLVKSIYWLCKLHMMFLRKFNINRIVLFILVISPCTLGEGNCVRKGWCVRNWKISERGEEESEKLGKYLNITCIWSLNLNLHVLRNHALDFFTHCEYISLSKVVIQLGTGV